MSVCVCLPPAPSVSVSAADSGSPSAPAKHQGIQEGTSDEEEVGSEGWLLRVSIDNKQEQQHRQQQQVCISQVSEASSAPLLHQKDNECQTEAVGSDGLTIFNSLVLKCCGNERGRHTRRQTRVHDSHASRFLL